jgi:hypothetical protein
MNGWRRPIACVALTMAFMPPAARAAGQGAAAAGTPVVMVVGCARARAQPHVWDLIHAGDRSESSRPGITTGEKAQLRGRGLGRNSYQLIGVADFVDAGTSRRIGVRGEILSPSRVNTTGMLVSGHRVAVKGLYIEGTPPRINLTSVVDLGGPCP